MWVEWLSPKARSTVSSCSSSPRWHPGPSPAQLHPRACSLHLGFKCLLSIKFLISTVPSCDPEGRGPGEEAFETRNLEMAISSRNKSMFLLQASQEPLISSVTRQSACCSSSDSVLIHNSIGPNYIMYVNFHLRISPAWTSLLSGLQPWAYPPYAKVGALWRPGGR